MPTRAFLLVDANVLIDYQTAGLELLSLVSTHVGQVHILLPVLREVDGLSESDCDALGLRVVEPTLEQVAEAERAKDRLSFEDHACLVVSRDNAWTCVTNDRALRRACVASSVAVLWGLELLIELVSSGHLPEAIAIQAAEHIQTANPRFLTADLLASFKAKLGPRR